MLRSEEQETFWYREVRIRRDHISRCTIWMWSKFGDILTFVLFGELSASVKVSNAWAVCLWVVFNFCADNYDDLLVNYWLQLYAISISSIILFSAGKITSSLCIDWLNPFYNTSPKEALQELKSINRALVKSLTVTWTTFWMSDFTGFLFSYR